MPRPIYEALIDRLKTHYVVDGIEVKEDSRFSEDLALDSLDVVELCMDIEDEYGIEVTDNDLSKVRSVQDAAELVQRLAPSLQLR